MFYYGQTISILGNLKSRDSIDKSYFIQSKKVAKNSKLCHKTKNIAKKTYVTQIIDFKWKNKYFFTATLNFTSSNCHIKHFYGQNTFIAKKLCYMKMNELKLPIGS